jgi:hypothetical protein
MFRHSDEAERPWEWLRHFAEDRASYELLLEDAGSLPIAAYRLARARCRAQAMPVDVPSLSELRVAADEVAAHTGSDPNHHLGVLIADCVLAGLPLILPPSFESAA